MKLLPGDLNSDLCSPHFTSTYTCGLKPMSLALAPHKHLYLWSDHRTKGAR